MKYYYLNRIAMAVLVALLLFFGTRTLINIASQEHPPEKPGYEVAGHEKPHGMKAEPDADSGGGGMEVLPLMASADAAQGEADAGLCKICHTFNQGGASLIGPNLYNVVNRKIASGEGFAYTGALKGKDGDWSYENLDVWLTNPQAFAAGTSMAFPGIPDLKKRANVIAFLRSNADTPAPLPEVSAEEPAATSEEPEEMDEDDAEDMDEDEAEDMDGHDDMDASDEAMDEADEAKNSSDEMDEPVAVEAIEETMEEILVVPATLSEDAPSEPSMGEDPSSSQPQPVYPDTAASDMMEAEAADKMINETTSDDGLSSQPQPVYPDTAASDMVEAEAADKMINETTSDSSSSQPQPVYPDGKPDGMDGSASMAPAADDGLSSQPQPVYPDTAASDMVEAEAADKMINETTSDSSSSQPQPVYPDGKPDGM